MSGAARYLGRMLPALGLAALCWSAAAPPAAAQFSWFGQGEVSSNDVYDTISSHGFRLAGPLMQNRNVYIADVFDRRQRRQRLIISREDGRILQRFLVDVGSSRPYAGLPGPGPVAPRQRAEPDFFSRLAHGFGDDGPPPRPPADLDSPDRPEAVEPRLPRPDRFAKPRPVDIEPRLATRRDDAPVTSRPLTPEPQPVAPSPAPARPAAATPPPAPAASIEKSTPIQQIAPTAAPVPAPAASPPPARATVVTTDPLRIPGVKEPEKQRPAATTAKAADPAKPVPKASDVPVAPLD